jgi:hypothetical protein
LTSVQRSLSVPFGDDGESVSLQETQILERVLSPEIVSEDENTPPSIGQIQWRNGLAVGEGGSIAHLEAVVEDAEWNIVDVHVDLTAFGLGVIQLNDRGLNGDMGIGDDIYTAAVVLPGLETGDLQATVSATDSFGSTSTSSDMLAVTNQPPRLIDVEMVPTSLERGQSVVVNIDAYDGHGVASVQIDLREYGGEVINLTNEGAGSSWAAMVEMPIGMTPGSQSLLVIATDGLGATVQQRVYTPADGVGSPEFGPHHVVSTSELPVEVLILNDRPVLVYEPATIPKSPEETFTYTVQASDPDGVERVQIKLGVYTPIGGSEWATMFDDGSNGGDQVAGDGNYSILLSVREGTPIGTHEVALRALDSYGELNTGSSVITLVEPNAPSGTGGGLSTAVLGGLGVVVFAGAVVVFTLMWRRGGQGGSDRFGMQ